MRLVNAEPSETYAYLYEHLDDNGIIAAQNALDDMPTIDAEPVIHAVWEKDGWRCECSNCSAFANLGQASVWKYCPRCGAKMDVEEG